MGVRDACGRQPWGLRLSSLWGHETCEGCAELGVRDACGRQHWGLRWSSLWGHETLSWAYGTHAGGSTGAFGGAPYGATKPCTGRSGRMRAAALGPSVELPMGPRNPVLGVRDACGRQHWGLRWSSLWGHETLYWAFGTHAG